jgi:hypothetical protein
MPESCARDSACATWMATSSASSAASGPRFDALLQRLAFVGRHGQEQFPIRRSSIS